MNSLARYLRAFITALRFTARGEQPPGLRHPELYAWIKEMAVLVDAVYAAADANGLDKTARQTIMVKLDGRSMKLETVFGTLRYHATQEYPSLLATSTYRRFNLGAILASNMNDRYWLLMLRQSDALQNSEVQAALERLGDHLDAIPTPSETSSSSRS